MEPLDDRRAEHARRAWWLGALTLAVVCGLQIAAFHGLRQDDAFITYRYAQNLAQGRGLMFNPGQRFLGATSPGHMLLSALVYLVSGRDATPSVMAAIGCMAWSAQAGLVYALALSTLGRVGAAAVALAVAVGAAQSFTWVPLETNLVAALSLATLLAAQRSRDKLAAVLMACACLMRPDALLLALMLFVLALRRRPSRLVAPCALFVALTSPWAAFAALYYGSPIPHSAVEKFHRSDLPTYFRHAMQHIRAVLVPVAAPQWLLTLAAAALLFAGIFVLLRRASELALFALYAFAHLLLYLYLRPFVGHDWHLYPTMLGSVIVVAAGLAWIARRAAWRSARWTAALTLLGWLGLASITTVRASHSVVDSYWTGFRDHVYRETANYLATHSNPGDQFASIEVGTLAYYSGLTAYDLGGLVTDLRRDKMSEHPVRFVVLDESYLTKAPPVPAVFVATDHGFRVHVYATRMTETAYESSRAKAAAARLRNVAAADPR